MSLRRILVALDTSAHSRAALEAASELASRWEGELLGLFVEDINLLRLAGLPFAREIGYASALPRELDPNAMESALRAIADQAREWMAEVAGKTRVPWTFRVARGSVATELLAALAEADLVTLGIGGRKAGTRLGSTALAVMTNAPRAVLLFHGGASIRPPAIVLFDGSESSLEALSAAAEVSEACGDGLAVLIPADAPKPARQLQSEAIEALEAAGRKAIFRVIDRAGAPELIAAAHREGAGLFVLPGTLPLLKAGGIEELVAGLACPVFVVRERSTPR